MAPRNSTTVFRCLTYALLLSLPGHILFASAQEDGELPKIGIVGGGVGGSAAAYFLRQLFGEQLQVDVFEGGRVGGRLALISIDGQEYEAGGSIIHAKNEYMVNFTNLFGLEKRTADDAGAMGLYNDKEGLFFKTSPWKFVTISKLFWRYGWDLKRISEWVVEIMSSFSRIYEYQEKHMAFTTVEDMLKAMDEKFINFTRISAQTMFKDAGFSETFINELVMAAMQMNFGQTLDTHGFVAAVSMAGVEHGLWAVKGGNKNIPEKLLQSSGARLIHRNVTEIYLIKNAAGIPSYKVEYEQTGQQGSQETASAEYDIVIMATPLGGNAKMEVQFEDFPSTMHIPDIPFHSLVAMFVNGQVNCSTFGVGTVEDLPVSIMTTSAEVFFNSVGKQTSVDQESCPGCPGGKPAESDSDGVWKVFLNNLPSETQVQSLFGRQKSIHLVNWLAYPEYRPVKELPSFVLHDRLYFINAIEAAASAMEMSVIGAKNVALLAYNQWFSHLDKIDEVLLPSGPSEESVDGRKVQEGVKSEEL